MERFRKIPKLFTWLIILLYLQTIISAVNGDHGGQNIAQNKEEESSLAQFVVETISRLRASHKSSWEKVKSIIREMQLSFKGPNEANVGAKQEAEKVKEAAKKTAGVSKMAVEESAKSAAEAVHKTAEKVKDSVSPDKGAAQDEL
ncbi:transmembrane protein [Citrus sinensis]|nr:transmembrane protein [Citrus sinensis]